MGAGLTLLCNTPYNPGAGWTHYATLLHEAAGWSVSGQGRAPTQGEMQAVLGSLSQLRIRGEFRTGADTGFLDNVVLERPAAPSLGADNFIAPAGNFTALLRNPDASFTRTLKNGTRIEYDAAGLMTASIDRNGNTTSYAYDAGGLLASITDPVGLVTTLAYTGGLLTSVTDPASRVTSFEHDGDGNLVKIVDPDLSQRLFAYDERHRLTAQTSKRGHATTYDYGFHGRNTAANRPDLSTVLVAPSEVVGLIDAGAGLGTPSNPAPFIRPAEVVAATSTRPAAVADFADGNGKR